jgi:hypothetical protein
VTDLSQFTREGNRIVIYSSRNGHASYRAVGSNPTPENSLSAPWPFSGDIYDFYLINECSDGGQKLDCTEHFQLISADYLGVNKPIEPSWLNYPFRYGPNIIYLLGTLDRFVQSLGIVAFLISPFLTWLSCALLGDTKGEDGPTGPKQKGSWLGRPED